MVVKQAWFLFNLIMIGSTMKGFELKSNSFKNKEFLDVKFTCKGENISPDLRWVNVPDKTKSFVLILEDPDASRKEPWVHWLVFNIPPNLTGFGENGLQEFVSHVKEDELLEGINDFGKIGYGGPCPPAGKAHNYLFRLYALDKKLPLKSGVTKKQLLKAMEGHIITFSELVGLYKLN